MAYIDEQEGSEGRRAKERLGGLQGVKMFTFCSWENVRVCLFVFSSVVAILRIEAE